MTDTREQKIKAEERQLSVRSVVVSLIVIAVFVIFVGAFYRRLYNEKRDNIIKDGRIIAMGSADKLDKYLSTNTDSVKLAAYTLDGMILRGATDGEIQEFLLEESTAIRSVVLENSTGLYGYINGRFFSGTNWVPPMDFVATARPWYLRPLSNPGEITILDPYVDAQSGKVMLALGKMLCDNISVVSLDVSLEQIQALTEDAVKTGGSDVEMILNERGKVIAHSDPKEIDKNYHDEKGTLGAAVVKGLSEHNESFFEIDLEKKHYVVYFEEIQNGWCCVSVQDATDVFRSLRSLFAMTIVVFVILIILLGYTVTKTSRLRYISESAVAASEAKSLFLSNMSHEIRTPINAVLGMNEMILRECEDETIVSYAQGIRTAGDNLLGIVNDILDFSKIEAGKLDIVPVDYDISSVLNDLVNMTRVRTDKKGLKFELDFDPKIPKLLRGDELRIKQIITNILSNAVKYTEKGTVTFKVGFEPDGETEDGIILKVAVLDTGIGIKPEDMDKLFSEFERIEENRNRSIEGTGLGMNITQKLLEKMGSVLNVESTYGKGSVFSFDLKQTVVKWDELGDYQSAYKLLMGERRLYREKFTAPEARLLVIDDNPMNLVVFKSLLKQTRVRIDTANDGNEGLALSREKKYDIIFFDHMMPDKDGIETLAELREETDNPNLLTHAVCLTANAVSGARDFYLSNGFDDYLTKPIDPEKLEDMLAEMIPAEKIVRSLEDGEEAEDEKSDEAVNEAISQLGEQGIIDIGTGLKNSGSMDAYHTLLKLFYDSIDEKAGELQEYLDKDDLKNYTIKVHALKSSAKIVGATLLGEEAQRLENAGKAKDTGYLRENNGAFIKEYLKFKEVLEPLFAPKDNRNKPVVGETLVKKVREEIKTAAEEMDCDALEAIFKRIEGYRIPDEQAGIFSKMKTAAEVFDYDTILELLQK